MSFNKTRWYLIFILLSTALLACSGGETGTGAGPADQHTTVGTIRGFGSVHVSGIQFATDSNTKVVINSVSDDESNLSQGMLVTIRGSVNTDGITGKADSIEYTQNIFGVVLQNSLLSTPLDPHLDVMGHKVVVDKDTIFENNVSNSNTNILQEITNNAVVEVSGYHTLDNGQVYATRIELEDANYNIGQELEIKGKISIVDTPPNTFKLMGSNLEIKYDSSTEFENNLILTPGVLVSVKVSSASAAPGITDFTAKSVKSYQPSDREFDDGDEVELEGIITQNYNSENKTFGLNGITVQVDDVTENECSSIANFEAIKTSLEIKLEVEGVYNDNDMLVADEIECHDSATIEINANVNNTDLANNKFWILDEPILVKDSTTLKDESNEQLKDFNINDLKVGDRLEMRAFFDADTNTTIATTVIRTKLENIEPQKEPTFEYSGTIVGAEFATNNTIISLTTEMITFDVSEFNLNETDTRFLVGQIVTIAGELDANHEIMRITEVSDSN